MGFQRVMSLARATPTSVLCDAWGANADEVDACKKGERPMTIREAGALAELHDLTLLDVLTV
jgi:hypothetical protein